MSSLFSALTVSVGGLAAQSSALGNISDDLANSQTVGFKSIGTNFEDLVTQSDATNNDPGGVKATPDYQNDVQGNLVQSAIPTSLAISGNGFFSVESASANADGTTSFNSTPLYTRQGDFTLDKSGYLVNSSGYYLTGWSVDSTGTVNKSTVQPIQISALLNNPVATSSSTFDANLPASAAVGFTSSASTVQIYDALGTTHDMTITWTKTGTSNWDATVVTADASGTPGTAVTQTIPFVFNDTNTVGSLERIDATGVNGGTGNYSVVDNSHAAEDAAQVTLNGLSFAGAGSQSITLNFGDYNESNGLTQFNDTNINVTSFSQNGLPQGSFTNLSIDSSGLVSINYSNGSLKTIAQIPIVQFNAQDQLQRVSGGAYTATLASGTANYGSAGSSGAGTIAANSLESSNVDIASAFTDMIQAQQIYSANAKTITTIDNMLTTIINTIQ